MSDSDRVDGEFDTHEPKTNEERDKVAATLAEDAKDQTDGNVDKMVDKLADEGVDLPDSVVQRAKELANGQSV